MKKESENIWIYSREELRELQQVNLRMAEYFAQFCREQGLRCCLCGGGCIGAVRHQGFIPWDDDLDFFMPRMDYDRLYALWKERADESRYVISGLQKGYYDGNQFLTIRDRHTTLVKDYQKRMKGVPHGVPLDIFPLDGCPNNKRKRRVQKLWANVHALYASRQIPEKHGMLMKIGSLLLLRLAGPERGYRIAVFARKQMSRYTIADCEKVTELCAGPGYMQLEYPKEAFAKVVWLPFADTKLPVPAGYDTYLKMAFGDYRTLPPVEQRVPRHTAVYVDLHHGYEETADLYQM